MVWTDAPGRGTKKYADGEFVLEDPVPVPDHRVDPFVLEDEQKNGQNSKGAPEREAPEPREPEEDRAYVAGLPDDLDPRIREKMERMLSVSSGDSITSFPAWVSRITTGKDGGIFITFGVEYQDKDAAWLVSDWQGVKLDVELRKPEYY